MITCYLQGGLGNQLFILFTTIAYALQNQQPVMFHYSEKLVHGYTVRYTYWHTFFSALKELTTTKPIMNGLPIIKEHKEGKYIELDKIKVASVNASAPVSAILYGYFQSFKYFQDEYNEISHLLGIDDMRNRYFNWFDKNDMNPETTVSMHFRLGDYKKLNNVLSLEYYKKSLAYIIDQYTDNNKGLFIPPLTVLYFCEYENLAEVNENIKILQYVVQSEMTKNTSIQCKFRYCNLTSAESATNAITTNASSSNQNAILGLPEDEMIIMSNCKYNIIANSTFSWWAAYIGDREDDNTHIVCYPDIKNEDLYPEKWTRISA